jgi:hypothetical protein
MVNLFKAAFQSRIGMVHFWLMLLSTMGIPGDRDQSFRLIVTDDSGLS